MVGLGHLVASVVPFLWLLGGSSRSTMKESTRKTLKDAKIYLKIANYQRATIATSENGEGNCGKFRGHF